MKMKKLLLMITLLAAMPAVLMAQKKPRVTFTAPGMELVFLYDDNTGGYDFYEASNVSDYPYEWQSTYEHAKKISIDPSFTDFLPTSTYKLFYNTKYVTNIPTISHLNTKNVTNMECMFRNSGITSLDISSWETNSLTNMNGMFFNCKKLASLNFGENFNTENVTDMSTLFSCCESLPSLDISMFNTSNVIDMSAMFNDCITLLNLDVSHFDTKKVTDMSLMFGACVSLPSLDVSGFETSNVTDMNSIPQFGIRKSYKKLVI